MNWLQVLVTVFGNAVWLLPMVFWDTKNELEDFLERQIAIQKKKDLLP